jgi:uncharacterized protein
MNVYVRISQATGFEWDASTVDKSWRKHLVSASECEQVFFNEPLIAAPDLAHSQQEPRFFMLGQTDAARPLFVVFTLRGTLIRVISARDMSRRERKAYGSR